MKFVVTSLAMLVATAAGAGTVYQDRDHAPQLIDVAKFPRMKLWPNARHRQSAEGHILVCEVPQEEPYVNACFQPGSNKSKTAWVVLQDVTIPGFVLTAYDLRSNGTLIAYYSPINTANAKK